MTDTTKNKRPTSLRRPRRRAYQALEEEQSIEVPEVVAVTERVETATIEDEQHASRLQAAEKIVTRAMWIARGAGLVPVPWLDFVALSAIQMTMLTQLSYLYGVDFSKNRAKKILISFSGAANTAITGGIVMHGVGRLTPGLSTFAALCTMPLLGGALTYAVGKTFIKHYELGGTLLDLDPESTRNYFQTQFQAAKNSGTA